MGLRSRLPQENHLNFDSFCELLKFLNLTYSKWETRRSWVFLKTLCCPVLQPQYQKLPPPPLKELKPRRRLDCGDCGTRRRISPSSFCWHTCAPPEPIHGRSAGREE